MTTTTTQKTIDDFKKDVAGYFKNNRWYRREDIIKTMIKEHNVHDKYGVTDDQIREIVNGTLLTGEQRKGDVIFKRGAHDSYYHPVGHEDKFYKIQEHTTYVQGTSEHRDGYQVVQFGEDDRGRKAYEVVLKNVPKSWAEQWVMNKLDPSLPKPAKLQGRELMKYGNQKAKAVTSLDALVSEGEPSKGIDLTDLRARPVLLYAAQEAGAVSDGRMMVIDQKTADKVAGAEIEKQRKQEYETTLRLIDNDDSKVPAGEREAFARKAADKAIKSLYEQHKGKYPNYKQLIPDIIDDKLMRPVGTSIMSDGTQLAWLYNGEHYIPVNLDKLAWIYKQVPEATTLQIGAFSGQSNDWGKTESSAIHGGILVFKQGDKVKGLLMPIQQNSVPEVIEKAATSSKSPDPVKPPEPAAKQPERAPEPVKPPEINKDELISQYRKEVNAWVKSNYTLPAPKVPQGVSSDLVSAVRIEETRIAKEQMQKSAPPVSDEDLVYNRLAQGNFSAYTTVHMTDAQKKILQKWVRSGKVLKIENRSWSGAGNRYNYYLKSQLPEPPKPPEHKPKDKSEPVSLSTLKEAEQRRHQYERLQDEARRNKDTIKPDSPRAKTWLKDPSRMDVEGIDTMRPLTVRPKQAIISPRRKHHGQSKDLGSGVIQTRSRRHIRLT